ncbi:conserved hypothetical secreted protein [Mycobacterium marinum M]|uniref:Conserved hypothetical secreted protein n=1 Tax=Mycobacterium marinum (strain ATCC BAA-535 / M) TaxID=216594 RepID=B2HLD4_MYCMM|nr:conserved hypothetical secreted protein [Mycobacterium marinum M]
MACPAPETAAALAPSVDTASVPDISEPPLAADTGLAWSVYDPSPVPVRTWHETERWAVGVVLASLLIAGTVALARPSSPRTAPSVVAELGDRPTDLVPPESKPESAPTTVSPATLPASPGLVEHLRPPTRAEGGLNRDATYISMLQSYGMTITDPSVVVADGRRVCVLIRQGYSAVEVTRAYMSSNGTLRPIDAANVVVAAVSVYCPEFTSSLGG